VWRHRSVSLNNEKICCEISEDKIAFCKKNAGLRSVRFTDSNSACLKVLVPVKLYFSSKTCLMKVNDIRTQQTAYIFDGCCRIFSDKQFVFLRTRIIGTFFFSVELRVRVFLIFEC
jgi:hypothetical protein